MQRRGIGGGVSAGPTHTFDVLVSTLTGEGLGG